MRQIIFSILLSAIFFSACDEYDYNQTPEEINPIMGTTIDSRDGSEYATVTLGDQIWMAENLHFNTTSSRCREEDSPLGIQFGRFYNWNDALTACPDGWRLPLGNDWDILAAKLGKQATCGKKLKSTSGWINNGNGTNESGFNALPVGAYYYIDDSTLMDVGRTTVFWSNEDGHYDEGYSETATLVANGDPLETSGRFKDLFFSIRCIKE